MKKETPAPRYRRERTFAQRKQLTKFIRNNFKKFFPKGPSAMITAEFNAQVECGRIKLGPPNSRDRRQYKKFFRPATLAGNFYLWGKKIRGYAPIRKNWTLKKCTLCKAKFWVQAPQADKYIHCSPYCQELFHFHCVWVAFDPLRIAPVTTAASYWAYTHDSRPPDVVAPLLIKSAQDLMAKQSLQEYFDEQVGLSEEQATALRERMFDVLDRTATNVSAQLTGRAKKPWTNQQVRLYLGLLDKLVPNASATTRRMTSTITDDESKDPADMSRSELEEALAKELEQKTVTPIARKSAPTIEHNDASN